MVLSHVRMTSRAAKRQSNHSFQRIRMIIYIDLGSYNGDTVEKYLNGEIFERGRECSVVQAFDLVEYPAEWQAVKDRHPNVSIAFNRMAVGIAEESVEFGAWPANPECQTTIKGNTNYTGIPGETIIQTVPRINFVGWLQRFVQPGNTVICKMDIEGAEYEILEELIKSGAIRLINYLYVEWHARLLPPEYEEREKWILANSPVQIRGWG